jgi:hypothetical protein
MAQFPGIHLSVGVVVRHPLWLSERESVCEDLGSFAHSKTLNLWLYMRLLSVAAQTYGLRRVR